MTMTIPKRETIKCVGCGFVTEMDSGFATGVTPSAEISTEQWALSQVQSMPLTSDDASPSLKAHKATTVAGDDPSIFFQGDECAECHGVQWFRIGDELGVSVREERSRQHK